MKNNKGLLALLAAVLIGAGVIVLLSHLVGETPITDMIRGAGKAWRDE